jgi:hypothetical protein
MPRDYSSFIASKQKKIHPTGFEPKRLNSRLFPWQADIVRWACRLGRASLFEDCGLGKAIQSLAWADAIVREGHGKTVLILCPLAVAQQTKSEAEKFSIETDCRVVREQSQVRSGINITNYDRLDKFDTSAFDAVVMDESSLLKGKGMAKTKKKILSAFGNCRFRLACTATPAPNDLTELAGHSEFMGLMREQEMLSMFFVHDSGHTQDWRLKGHGAKAFWRWVSSWAVSISKPSDLGDFSDDGYILPPLNIDEIVIEDSDDAKSAGFLFNKGSLSATGVHAEKRSTAERRAEVVAEKVNASDASTTPWLAWVDTDYEADALFPLIKDAVEVRGSDSIDAKEEKLVGFTTGKIRRMVSKPSLAGWGVNWQHCWNESFIGLSYSFEMMYQAIRRCLRFGQTYPVNVYIYSTETEYAINAAVWGKQKMHEAMKSEMAGLVREFQQENLYGVTQLKKREEDAIEMTVPSWL